MPEAHVVGLKYLEMCSSGYWDVSLFFVLTWLIWLILDQIRLTPCVDEAFH